MKACLLLVSCIASAAVHADALHSCMVLRCIVGDHVRAYSSPSEPATACATRALTEYVGVVFGLKAIGTSEDQVVGETAEYIASLRRAAGVSNLAEASSACWIAPNHQKLIILEIPPDSAVIKVVPAAKGYPFWLPATFLDRM